MMCSKKDKSGIYYVIKSCHGVEYEVNIGTSLDLNFLRLIVISDNFKGLYLKYFRLNKYACKEH